MADDWFKLDMSIFGNRKIKYLRRLPNGDSIALFWIALLAEARRCNSDGKIFLTESIPYTPDLLADEFHFGMNTVKSALDVFEQLDMIYTKDGFITIAGWEDHQNAEGLAKIREQTRKRVAKYRENQKTKQIGSARKCVYCGGFGDTVDHVIPKANGGLDIPENVVCSCLACNMQKNDRNVADFLNNRLIFNEAVDIASISENEVLQRHVQFDYATQRFVALRVTQGNATEEDIEEEKEIEVDIEKERERIDFQSIVDLYHEICKSFPSVRSVSDARKKAIRARLNTYTLDDFRIVFENAEASSFLKGKNDRNWQATFDWLLKDANMAKVLEGNYKDKPSRYGRKEPIPGWMGGRESDEDEIAAVRRMMADENSVTVGNNPELADRAEKLKQMLQR